MNTVDGIIATKMAFIGKGKNTSKIKFRKNSNAKKSSNEISQKRPPPRALKKIDLRHRNLEKHSVISRQ